MPPIVMNVGPRAIGAAGGGGGGQTLGNAQGSITINVNNVTQANKILQNSAKAMAQAFVQTGKAAQAASQQQIAASRAAAAAAQSASRQQIAANNAQISGIKLAATQQNVALQQQTAAARANAAQQAAATRQVILTQRQQHQAVMQNTQQQIAANRLLISNLNAQAAAARAAARAQQQAAQQAVGGWQQVGQVLTKIRTELVLVGAGANLLTGMGLRFAGGLEEARIQLGAITGSMTEGNRLLEELRDKGREAGVPFTQMSNFAVQLLPVLERSTAELDRWFEISRRVAVLNRGPMGGLQGAAFSLREAFLSVEQGGRDFVSLADRFNISKKALIEALEIEGGDFVNAIDRVLDQMGITVEMADMMAESFNTGLLLARDAAYQLLAEGFTPLIKVLGPMLQMSADWLGILRESNPVVVSLGVGLVTLVAVGTPLLLLVNQLTIAWTALGVAARGAILSMTGIGGIAIAIASATPWLSTQVGRVYNWTRQALGKEPQTQEEIQQQFRNYVADFLDHFRFVLDDILNAMNWIPTTIMKGVALMARQFAKIAMALGEAFPLDFISSQFERVGNAYSGFADQLEEAANNSRAHNERFRREVSRDVTRIQKELRAGPQEDVAAIRAEEERISVARQEAIVKWARDMDRIEADAHQERIDAAIQFGKQMNEIQFQYEQSRAREAEDFARNRLRQEQRFQRDVEELREDAVRREADWAADLADSIEDLTKDFLENQREQQEDHDEKIADMREDHNKKIVKLEEDYQEDREKAIRDHSDRLLEAASRLDAVAVFEEQRRFAREQEEREKDHRERIQEERDNLEDRIAEEEKNFAKRRRREQEDFEERLQDQREAHQKRIDEARESDQRRLDDMREALQLQRDEEDEDRAIRLQRQADDHERQLSLMQEAHDDRMEQINAQEREALESLKDSHEDELEELGLYNEIRSQMESDFLDRSLRRHEEYFRDWDEREQALRRKRELQERAESRHLPVREYQRGGFVNSTGLAKLHSGEYVLNPNTTKILQDMLGGRITQSGLVAMMASTRASATGSGRGDVYFSGDVSVSVMGTANMNELQMKRVAKEAFIEALQEASQ